MKQLFLLTVLSLVLVACDRHDKPSNNPPLSEQDADNTGRLDADNTGRNVRDRNAATITPPDQSESAADRTITQQIRQAVVSDRALSMDAKNIKIVTINGVVTLRGPVANAQEKDLVEKKASDVPGISKVINQLEIINRK